MNPTINFIDQLATPHLYKGIFWKREFRDFVQSLVLGRSAENLDDFWHRIAKSENVGGEGQDHTLGGEAWMDVVVDDVPNSTCRSTCNT
jgi:hypothetical protein